MRAPRTRSAQSNGSRLFLGTVDGRTEAARRYRDLFEALTDERGGVAAMRTGEIEAARIYAGLAVMLARMHVEIAEGKPVDAEQVGQIGDRMDRAMRRMGPVKAAQRQTLEQRLAAERKAR